MARWRHRASGVEATVPDTVDPGSAWVRLDDGQRLDGLTIKELRALADARGVKWHARWRKSDAIKALGGATDGR